MQVDFTAIDHDLNRLPRSKANSFDIPTENKEPTVEDDIAIAEAIAQIEKELKGKEPQPIPANLINSDQSTQTTIIEDKQQGPFSFFALALILLIGFLTAKFALKLL